MTKKNKKNNLKRCYKEFKKQIKIYRKILGLYDFNIFVDKRKLKQKDIMATCTGGSISFTLYFNTSYDWKMREVKNTAIHELLHVLFDDFIDDMVLISGKGKGLSKCKKNPEESYILQQEESMVSRLANTIENI